MGPNKKGDGGEGKGREERETLVVVVDVGAPTTVFGKANNCMFIDSHTVAIAPSPYQSISNETLHLIEAEEEDESHLFIHNYITDKMRHTRIF